MGKPLLKRSTLLYLILLISAFSCKPKELLISNLDVASIKLQGFPNLSAKAINETVVSFELPYGTNLKSIIPTFELAGEGSVIPASGIAQDFSKPVYYTTIHPSGGKKIYEIRIVVANQPEPLWSSFSKDSLFAGEQFVVNGQYFGKFGLDVKVALVFEGKETVTLGSRLVDSSRIEVSVPDTLLPNRYSVAVSIKDKRVVSTKSIGIKYPKPQLASLNRKSVLPLDTVRLTGRFLDAKNYGFVVVLKNKAVSDIIIKNIIADKSTGFKFILPAALGAGSYSIGVENTGQKTSGILANTELVVFDPQKPFVSRINGTKGIFKAGETLIFDCLNFEKVTTRFYQVSLIGTSENQYINGIYDAAKKQLGISLPNNLKKGEYQLEFSLSNPATNYNYAFSIDQKLTIQ